MQKQHFKNFINNVTIRATYRKDGEEQLLQSSQYTTEYYMKEIEQKMNELQNNNEQVNVETLALGKYGTGISFTKNMGNYNSLKLEVYVELPIILDMNNLEESSKNSSNEAHKIIEKIYETNSKELLPSLMSVFS